MKKPHLKNSRPPEGWQKLGRIFDAVVCLRTNGFFAGASMLLVFFLGTSNMLLNGHKRNALSSRIANLRHRTIFPNNKQKLKSKICYHSLFYYFSEIILDQCIA